MPLYYCAHCDYDAKGLKANFTKHCNSNKHKNLLLLASKMLIPQTVNGQEYIICPDSDMKGDELCDQLEKLLLNNDQNINKIIQEYETKIQNILNDMQKVMEENNRLTALLVS